MSSIYSRTRSSTKRSLGQSRRRQYGCHTHRLHRVYTCAHPTPSIPPPHGGRGVGARWATQTLGTSFYNATFTNRVGRSDKKKTMWLPHPSPPSRPHVCPPHRRLPCTPWGPGGGSKVDNTNTGVHRFSAERDFLQPTRPVRQEKVRQGHRYRARSTAFITLTCVLTYFQTPPSSFPRSHYMSKKVKKAGGGIYVCRVNISHVKIKVIRRGALLYCSTHTQIKTAHALIQHQIRSPRMKGGERARPPSPHPSRQPPLPPPSLKPPVLPLPQHPVPPPPLPPSPSSTVAR